MPADARLDDTEHARPDSIAINVSPVELLDPLHCSMVAAALREWQLPPESLCLEITETALVSDVRAALGVLHALLGIGVKFALDDFGTGLSSLNHLKRFPVSIVKIDRSFVAGLANDPVDAAIVAAVAELSHTLGRTVVAEGVETSDQRKQLTALGCDNLQGYLFSRPLSTAAIQQAPEWFAGLAA